MKFSHPNLLALRLMLVAAAAAAAAASAEPDQCVTYKRFTHSSSIDELATDSIQVAEKYAVSRVGVSLSLAHQDVGALQVTLLHPASAGSPATPTAVVLKAGGRGEGTTLAGTYFSDDALENFPSATGSPYSGRYKPAQPLSAFAGQSADGAWHV